jgi:hypothetical protein
MDPPPTPRAVGPAPLGVEGTSPQVSGEQRKHRNGTAVAGAGYQRSQERAAEPKQILLVSMPSACRAALRPPGDAAYIVARAALIASTSNAAVESTNSVNRTATLFQVACTMLCTTRNPT